MKPIFTFVLFFLYLSTTNGQAKITAITSHSATAASSYTYTSGGKTYNWGVSPNNTLSFIDEFTSGSFQFEYAAHIPGQVKIRRVNNASISGNFTLIWAKTVNSGNVYNLFPEYDNEMESVFNTNSLDKGTDNLFQNTGDANINNIERLDWIVNAGFSTYAPDKVGFAVFERGNTGAHDNFCIAAITGLDGSGDPNAYGPIVRVNSSHYGDVTNAFDFNVVKAQYPNDLLHSTTISQRIGGVYIALQTLGVGAGETVYGYSLFSDDLPSGATSANLIDYTNATYFPNNTSVGGLDLTAITGVFIESTVLPARFTSFSASENNRSVNLKWSVVNETSADHYVIERSADGQSFDAVATIKAKVTTTGVNSYSYTDDVSGVSGNRFYYRVRQYDLSGAGYLTQSVLVRLNGVAGSTLLYPNPVKNNLFLSINSRQNKEIKIMVTNTSGQQVISERRSLVAGNNSIMINAAGKLPAGIYTLTITDQDGNREVKQFIKK
ncbi:MAG: T9SS type A sorting domain-containing protein [Chitinophagaceae bacterium]|nr:T9SS type A sorting domain-containing protein [Chitinophagaceae bacterium]